MDRRKCAIAEREVREAREAQLCSVKRWRAVVVMLFELGSIEVMHSSGCGLTFWVNLLLMRMGGLGGAVISEAYTCGVECFSSWMLTGLLSACGKLRARACVPYGR